MRERITYILRDASAGFDPRTLEVSETSFALSEVNAAKELSITFSVGDLPQEVCRLAFHTNAGC